MQISLSSSSSLSGLSSSMAIAAAIAVRISKRITRPINELKQAAEDFSKGNYDVVIKNDSKDEIGRLAASFSYEVENVRRSKEELMTEKMSVERKVEEAVRESETQVT